MTAVPDPRFRDQLAEEQKHHRFDWWQQRQTWKARCACKAWEEWVTNTSLADDIYRRWQLHAADALLPLVEARVQAAANRRAEEERERWITALGVLAARHSLRWFALALRDRAAALAVAAQPTDRETG